MAKGTHCNREEFYTIRGTDKVVRVGDCVLMRFSKKERVPYMARVESIEADVTGIVMVQVRWYYRPEETKMGRRQFHGVKELFLSDRYDYRPAHKIEDKCVVHTFKNYLRLEEVGPEDYFCRHEYNPVTGGFTPERVAVYCKCELPYNPDVLMIQCGACRDWYHPVCLNMTNDQAKQLDSFTCPDCLPVEDDKKLDNGNSASALVNGKEE